jgi:hypothetical protein
MVAVLSLGLVAPAAAQPDDAATGPKLRRWHFGLQGVTTWRNRHDVFGRAELPPGEVDDRGRGGGLLAGYRFGDRFLLDVQVTLGRHEIADSPAEISDLEALVTGTVLFRETRTVQPFLRGGFGGAGELLELGPDAGHVFVFGPAALAGGGLQFRLSSRFSVEVEVVATFANFLEVHDESAANLWPEESWQVRVSNTGWRTGTGIVVWF